MFDDEELALLAELVEDKIAQYEKQIQEAHWARLATTEVYLTGRLGRLKTIDEKLRQASMAEKPSAAASDQSPSAV